MVHSFHQAPPSPFSFSRTSFLTRHSSSSTNHHPAPIAPPPARRGAHSPSPKPLPSRQRTLHSHPLHQPPLLTPRLPYAHSSHTCAPILHLDSRFPYRTSVNCRCEGMFAGHPHPINLSCSARAAKEEYETPALQAQKRQGSPRLWHRRCEGACVLSSFDSSSCRPLRRSSSRSAPLRCSATRSLAGRQRGTERAHHGGRTGSLPGK
jgi:hypothetical protein